MVKIDHAGKQSSTRARRPRQARLPADRGAGPPARAAARLDRQAAATREDVLAVNTIADRPARHRRRPRAGRRRRLWRPRAGAEPAAGADRPRRRRPAGRAGHQGVRAGRHGPARPAHRRHRLRQERAAAHPGARPGAHPLLRDPQLRPGRLQGRRDLPRPGRARRTSPRSSPTWRTSCRWSTGCRTPCTARWSAARSCCASAGNYASLRDYERARDAGRRRWTRCRRCSSSSTSSANCSRPSREFIDLFVMIGRLGRSLGVHLLLASQRLDEGRLRGLETHLSYRIGLRTFSADGEPRSCSASPTPTSCRRARQRLPARSTSTEHDPVQGRLRLRRLPGDRRRAARRPGGGRRSGQVVPVRPAATCRAR